MMNAYFSGFSNGKWCCDEHPWRQRIVSGKRHGLTSQSVQVLFENAQHEKAWMSSQCTQVISLRDQDWFCSFAYSPVPSAFLLEVCLTGVYCYSDSRRNAFLCPIRNECFLTTQVPPWRSRLYCLLHTTLCPPTVSPHLSSLSEAVGPALSVR